MAGCGRAACGGWKFIIDDWLLPTLRVLSSTCSCFAETFCSFGFGFRCQKHRAGCCSPSLQQIECRFWWNRLCRLFPALTSSGRARKCIFAESMLIGRQKSFVTSFHYTSRSVHTVIKHTGRNLALIKVLLQSRNLSQGFGVPDELLKASLFPIIEFDAVGLACTVGARCTESSRFVGAVGQDLCMMMSEK